MAAFHTDLVVKVAEDTADGKWEVILPLVYESDVAQRTITVPPEFQTDFCSVPRIPGIYDLLGNRARKAGTVHDYLYSSHIVSRFVADLILREMVQVDGVGHAEAELFYYAARMFGWIFW